MGGTTASIIALAAAAPAQESAPAPAAASAQANAKELQDLRLRLEQFEGLQMLPETGKVDLSGEELPFLDDPPDAHPLALPWYRKIDLWGFGAAGYFDSGGSGTRPNGGFLIKEASLFIDAAAWEDWSFFFEVQTNRLGQDDKKYVRTGEVYAHGRRLLEFGNGESVGIKIGRFDIPFGEEYLWQDASDNLLITNSAAYPYGFDEGILFYGTCAEVGWVAALTDGTDARSAEDDPSKALNAKVYGNPWESLYLSASVMKNGDAAKSAFEWGGSHSEPVGAGGAASSAGQSPSDKVDALLYELDAIAILSPRLELALAVGAATIDDEVDAFDRNFSWFSLQPSFDLTEDIYVVARYSEIGTYDSGEGYHFDGKTFAGGNASYGYDTKRLQRVSLGLGWRLNPKTLFKLEIGRDTFEVVDASAFDPGNDDRDFVGFEIVLSF